MKWIYHIVHVWENNGEEHYWEDILLRKASDKKGKKQIWLTINSLPYFKYDMEENRSLISKSPYGQKWFDESKEAYEYYKKYLSENEYYCEKDPNYNMVVRELKTIEQCLIYVKKYLQWYTGDNSIKLIEGKYKYFMKS